MPTGNEILVTVEQADPVDVTGGDGVLTAVVAQNGDVVTVDVTSVGDRGPKGDLGPANTLTIGTVVAAEEADATITGTAPAQTLNLELPRGLQGIQGPAGTITVGTVTTGATASVTNTGTASAAVLNFVFPDNAVDLPIAISDVSGLEASLDAKANFTHDHLIEDVTGLQAAIDLATTKASPPSLPTSPATAGQTAVDANFFYVAVATNLWKRVPLESFGSLIFQITSQPSDATSSTGGSISYTIESTASPAAQAAYVQLTANGVSRVVSERQQFLSQSSETQQYSLTEQANLWNTDIDEASGAVRDYTAVTLRSSSGDYARGIFYRSIFRQVYLGHFVGYLPDSSSAPDHVMLKPGSGFNGTAATVNVNYGRVDVTSLGTAHGPGWGGPWDAYWGGVVGAATAGPGALPTVLVARGIFSVDYYGGLGWYTTPTNYYAPNIGISNPFVRLLPDGNALTNLTSVPTVNAEGQSAWWLMRDIVWGGERFVAIGWRILPSQVVYALSSANGLSWSQHAITGSTINPRSIAYGNNLFVSVGTALSEPGTTDDVLVSANGTTWTNLANVLPAQAIWHSVEFRGGVFVAYAQGLNGAAFSVDGQSWTLVEGFSGLSAPTGTFAYLPETNTSTESTFLYPVSTTESQRHTISRTGGTGSTTFTFSYSNAGGGSIAIQWQRRASSSSAFGDVSGATGTTLTLTGLTLADSGSQFRARITRTGGTDQAPGQTDTYFTNVATLTVI